MKKLIMVVAVVMVAVLLAVVCVACSADSYEKQLEKKGYTVTKLTQDNKILLATAATALGAEGDVEFIVTGVKDGSSIQYVKFEKASDAKATAKKLKDAKGENSKISVSGSVLTVKITAKK